MNNVDKLLERLRECLGKAQAIATKADEENRDFTDTERAEVAAMINESGTIKTELKAAKADAKVRQTLAELGGDLDEADNAKAKRLTPTGRHTVGKSLGDTFTNSAEYKSLLDSVPGGHFSKDHRIQTRPVSVDSLLQGGPGGAKALVTGGSDTSAGSLIQTQFIGLQVGAEAFSRPLMLRDLVTAGTTQSDLVEYVRVTSMTNNAAPTAEATTTANGIKPESGLTTLRVQAPVRTLAHWLPITKRAMSDAAQVLTLIDGFLQFGLEEELEDQMVSGDGLGENFTGIAATSGVQAQAYDTSLLVTLRKAKTKVRTIGRSIPTGYVINPLDVEALDLLMDGEERFYFGGPSGTLANSGLAGPTTAPLWNLPVIETEAVPVGTAYVGDWRKAILWDREQSSITMSDSHASFFVQNLVAILAEMRAAFGVIQPSAFVAIDLSA
jgi:HK97 family phage major capsid protein